MYRRTIEVTQRDKIGQKEEAGVCQREVEAMAQQNPLLTTSLLDWRSTKHRLQFSHPSRGWC